jgi:hypothetical protein
MDFVDYQSRVRRFDLFLSGGASTVPEPVYERDVRRHVETHGNRTQPDAIELPPEPSEPVYFERIDIDLEHNTISVSRDLQTSDKQE